MKQGDVLTLEVDSINSEGEGIARCGEEKFVVFAANALPGERVKARLAKVSKRYAVADVLEILKTSGVRISPKCASYMKCGGCQLQHVSYRAQLGIKAKILSDAMRRIAGITLPKGIECVPSPNEWGYRNKTTFPVGQSRSGPVFGYYERGSHRIVPFASCPVLAPRLEALALRAIEAVASSGFKGYGEKAASGDIRYIAARCAGAEDAQEALLGLVLARDMKKRESGRLRDICQKLSAADGFLAGASLNINASPGNFIWGPQFKQLCGKKTITHVLNSLAFNVDISSFFQINALQAQMMFAYAAKLLENAAPSSVLELYSGTGSLTAHIAAACERLDAVEEWRPSVRMLEENLGINGIDNVSVHAQSSEDFMKERASSGRYDAVVLDPPRTGCAESVIDGIKAIAPETVIYVSCNPATLARDIARLTAEGRLAFEGVKPFDMFPQTAHVESVALLTARSA